MEVYFDEELEGTDLAYQLIIDNAVVMAAALMRRGH